MTHIILDLSFFFILTNPVPSGQGKCFTFRHDTTFYINANLNTYGVYMNNKMSGINSTRTALR